MPYPLSVSVSVDQQTYAIAEALARDKPGKVLIIADVHFHCCVIDGVFVAGVDWPVQFAEAAALTSEDLAAVQQQVRTRVLRWFARAGHLELADARDMASWDHGGGFSLDASVRIDGPDRSGSERLLRYCARPPFALERLSLSEDARSTEGLGHTGARPV